MSDVSSVLQKLKEANKKRSVSIFLPSLNKKVKFLPFTLKQQKQILSQLPTGPADLITFNNVFNKIIIDNSEEDIDLSNINSIDRLSVVLTYRVSSLGSTYNIENKKINLNKILENIENFDNQDILQPKTIIIKDLSVEVCFPSLKYDSEVNDNVIKQIDPEDNTQTILSKLFTSEILKYIKSITIADEKTDLYSLPYKERLELVEELPGTLSKKIFSHIETVKKAETSISTVNGVKIDVSNELFT